MFVITARDYLPLWPAAFLEREHAAEAGDLSVFVFVIVLVFIAVICAIHLRSQMKFSLNC